jgi:hypothetical protein
LHRMFKLVGSRKNFEFKKPVAIFVCLNTSILTFFIWFSQARATFYSCPLRPQNLYGDLFIPDNRSFPSLKLTKILILMIELG